MTTDNLEPLKDIISPDTFNTQSSRDVKIEIGLEVLSVLGVGLLMTLLIGTWMSAVSPEPAFIIEFFRFFYVPLYLDRITEFAAFIILFGLLSIIIPFIFEFILKRYMTISLEITPETVNNKNVELYINNTDSTCYLVYNSEEKYKIIQGEIDEESSITLDVTTVQSSDSKNNLLEKIKTHKYLKDNPSEYVYQRSVHFMRKGVPTFYY